MFELLGAEGALTVALLTGLVCFFFAKEKNYNPYLWFAGGFFFSFLAIVIIAIIKKRVKKTQ